MNNGIRALCLVSFFGTASLLIAPAHAAEGVGTANSRLRATIQKWVGVMKETQQVQQDWKRNKQILEDSGESLRLEIGQLKEEIASAKERIAAGDTDSVVKLERKRQFEAGRESLRVQLDRVEGWVSEVLPLLPEELSRTPKMEAAMADHRKFVGTGEKEELSLNKRLTAMLTILAEAEKFNQTVQYFPNRPKEVEGEQRLFDVLYFGVSTGYAVDQEGTVAFQMRPGADGWEDRRLEGAGDAAAVRELLNVANKSGETILVTVPMVLGK